MANGEAGVHGSRAQSRVARVYKQEHVNATIPCRTVTGSIVREVTAQTLSAVQARRVRVSI